MDAPNDFAFNGGTVPIHSGTGRPRILCGLVSSNEIFNHYGDSGRTDNVSKEKKCLLNERVYSSICVLQC